MPPDETDGLEEGDLPGLHDDQLDADSPSTEPEGLDDSDLPGLDDDSPSDGPEAPPEAAETPTKPEWTRAELDEWFESDFGGDKAFNDFYFREGGYELKADDHPDLHFGLTAYRHLASDVESDDFAEQDPWSVLSHEVKTRFRSGWEDWTATGVPAGSVIEELTPYDAMGTLVSARHKLRSLPRWIFVGGGFGILGLVLAVGFFLRSGSDDADDAAVAVPSETPVEATAPPSAEPVVADTEAAAVAVEDEPAAELVVVPEVRTIDVEGEEVDVTLWRAQTATHVLVASPSLNGSPDNLAGFAGMLTGQGCANVLIFDSSQTSSYASTYLWIIDHLEDFGFAPDAPFSVFGSSATFGPALVAADERDGQEVLGLTPSEPPPFDWEDIVPRIGVTYPIHVVAVGTTGDVQYRDVIGEWLAAGYEAQLVEGENHGTPFFSEPAAEPILADFVGRICGARGGFHLSPADGAAGIEAFYEALNEAQVAGDTAAMAALLHPAVFDIYGVQQCAAYLTSIVNPDVVFTPEEVLEFGRWQWERDGVTTPVDDAFTVMVDVTVSGEDQGQVEAHIAYSGGDLTWFTDCGDPLPDE